MSNELLPLSTPGLYRLWFCTQWTGCQCKGLTLDEIYRKENGAGVRALIQLAGWKHIPGGERSRQFINEFMECDAARREVFAAERKALEGKPRKPVKGVAARTWSQSQNQTLNFPGF